MKIFYFSGTGNSYWIAGEIGKYFSAEPESITGFRGMQSIKVEDGQIGIIAPVYLNDIPSVMKEFLLHLSFANNTPYVFAVLSSGSGKNKNGFQNISIALAQQQVQLSLANDIMMPSSFQTRNNMDEILGEAPQKISEICKSIEERRRNYTPERSMKLPKNFTKLSFLYKSLTRMTVTDQCNGCGLCAKLCPTKNITIENGKAVHGNNCIACIACANWCPNHATAHPMLKGQYHHPDISADDLI